ncbi:hypothetical protein QA612_06985 [Evansella sp. AB-P1]|uniref:hypothetical protein n=1 Tax=Evansella sp. AB-P1 TaxID=3037653 RepID=UPI0024202BC5|nr:hypothetical protein [Evansella sp. AB-P1]MDG5787233.1 hypothetical protein [Evansella sp. AB-P1]
MGAFIPLMIILIIVITSYTFVKQSNSRTKKFIYGQRLRWMLSSYVIVLLLGGVTFFILPVQDFPETSVVSEVEDRVTNEAFIDNFYDSAFEGKIDEVDGVVVSKHLEFPFEEEELFLENVTSDYGGIMMIVEKKEGVASEIIATHYSTGLYIQGEDFTEKLSSTEITLSNHTLTVIPPEQTEIRIADFGREFTIAQFAEKDGSDLSTTASLSVQRMGHDIIYVIVPEQVEVTSTSGNIHFINDETYVD